MQGINKQRYQAYAAATQTVAKTRQIVMLYDGAIRYLQQASEAMADKRIEERYHLLVKASEIISGLQGCLDFENGGEVAQILYNFYSTTDLRIFALHRTANQADCEQVIRELKQMREAWQEIDQTSTNTAASSDAASAPSAPEPQETAPAAVDTTNIILSA